MLPADLAAPRVTDTQLDYLVDFPVGDQEPEQETAVDELFAEFVSS